MAMQTIAADQEGKLVVVVSDISKFLEAIQNRSKEQQWKEEVLSFRIDANNQIAQIWTPYNFYVNDTFSHCGVNIFQLFNNGERWKIIAIADTRNKEGCK